MLKACLTLFAAAMVMSTPLTAQGDILRITMTGTVENNWITRGPFASVHANDHAVATFEVDSDLFQNSPVYPTRGYIIDRASFSMTIGAATTGMPASLGATVPYLVLRNNDPRVDGFLISNRVDNVGGIPLDGGTGVNMGMSFLRTFTSDTVFPSLDILDIDNRTFGFELMSSYDWTIGVTGNGSLLVMYETISIENLTNPPFCAADYNSDGGVDGSDIEAFFNEWQDGITRADVNQDGGVDGADIEAFFTVWEAGSC